MSDLNAPDCDHDNVERDDDGLSASWMACSDCGAQLMPERNEDGGTDWVVAS